MKPGDKIYRCSWVHSRGPNSPGAMDACQILQIYDDGRRLVLDISDGTQRILPETAGWSETELAAYELWLKEADRQIPLMYQMVIEIEKSIEALKVERHRIVNLMATIRGTNGL